MSSVPSNTIFFYSYYGIRYICYNAFSKEKAQKKAGTAPDAVEGAGLRPSLSVHRNNRSI